MFGPMAAALTWRKIETEVHGLVVQLLCDVHEVGSIAAD